MKLIFVLISFFFIADVCAECTIRLLVANHYPPVFLTDKQGKPAEAISYLRQAITQQHDTEIAAHLGEVLWKTGEQEEFVQRVDANGDTFFEKGTRESFNWMDASVQKRFLNNKISTTFGVRNLFDVTEIESTALPGGTQENPRNITFGYGRSYFLKLSYNLNL